MVITVKEVNSKKELTDFVKFPMELYKSNKNYVPPMINEELDTLDKEKNPVFNDAEAKYFLAYNEDQIVGRIAVMINHREVVTEENGTRKVRFGWFDVIDDIEVSKALLEKAEEIAKQKKLKRIEGPMGFSNLEKAGALTKGHDRLATMVTLFNYPYYIEHFEKLGYQKAMTWLEYEFDVPEALPEKVTRFTKLIKEKYGLEVIKFKNKKEVLPYVDQLFKLLDETYSKLESYVPITKEQISHYKEKYFKFIALDYMCFIRNKDNELVAFAITMPSYSKALQKAGGKMLPFGWYHLLKAGKTANVAAFYLIGIQPKLQGKGVTAVVFKELMDAFQRNGITKVETNPELEDNLAVQQLWKNYSPELHKKRSTYFKEI